MCIRDSTLVWLDAKAGIVLVDAASMKKADSVITRLVELLGGGLKLAPIQTELAPATAMAGWLADKEAPAGFSLDRDCELKQPDSEKATVRYARHTLDIAEVAEHIKSGKLPTQLAMTWAGRVSFVLTDSMALKKIKLLDVVMESAGRDSAGAKDFDADVAIATGELGQLIPQLLDALGGAQSAAAPGLEPASADASVAPWDALPA